MECGGCVACSIREDAAFPGQVQDGLTGLEDMLHVVAADGVVVFRGAESTLALLPLAVGEAQQLRQILKLIGVI